MTAPDPILTAVTEAILGEEATVTYGYYGTTSLIDAEHAEDIARLALAAARPLIEAEVREAVARELDDRERRWRTRLDATEDLGRGTYYSGLALAYHDAARIARGGYEGTGSDD